MQVNRLLYLFQRYHTATLTEAELQELKLLMQATWKEAGMIEKEAQLSKEERLSMLNGIFTPKAGAVRFIKRTWLRYAAAILLVFGVSTYIYMSQQQQQIASDDQMSLQNDIAAGKEGAILTLADGSQVVLDSLGDGFVAAQNGAQVLLKNGQIAYTATGIATGGMAYNTMTTPKGRQFQVTLHDGTQVWLNAASSIRYPTAFIGKERKVFVTGEVYFEVAQNAAIPFRVNINNKAEVDVLGTSFNINAYENEQWLSTTLLEGSVRVSLLTAGGGEGSFAFAQDDKGKAQDDKGLSHDDKRFTHENKGLAHGDKGLAHGDKRLAQDNKMLTHNDKRLAKDNKTSTLNSMSVIIKPGQQAQFPAIATSSDHPLYSPDQIRVVKVKDIDKVMAWKNGVFNFEGATLEEVMRQLERWYDIEVVYENGVPDIEFLGKMERNLSLSVALRMLEKSNVKFRLEGGRRLVIQS